VRVALVSPYSYTYPGGVGLHVEALAGELQRAGHDVRLLAPYDPDDRLARVMHRGVSPQRRPLPDPVIPLGRTVWFPMNGAVSNLSFFPTGAAVLGHELRTGGFDVVHVHEPNAFAVSWFASRLVEYAWKVPTTGARAVSVANQLTAKAFGSWTWTTS
jgi:phosphatidylinositol alpha-mannosyltransferase